MGNVQAATAPPPQFLAPEPPPPPPGYNEKKPETPINTLPEFILHPGVMEDLHKKTKDVFPTPFDGIKVMVNKGLSNHFQVSHTISMSNNPSTGYRFGATYVGTQQLGPNEAFPILHGDIDPSGNMNANIIHQIGERLRFKLGCQFSHVKTQAVSAGQLTTDYKGDKFSASLTIANPDLINDSGVLVAHYLHAITSNISLGAELAYQRSPQIPGREISLLSVAGRYTGVDNCFSGTVGTHALHLCYYQKASEQLQIGCEWETNLHSQESTASIGYQIDLPKIDLLFRGSVDSNWSVAAVLEKRLQPLPFTMSISGMLNHSKQTFLLGFGFIIG